MSINVHNNCYEKDVDLGITQTRPLYIKYIALKSKRAKASSYVLRSINCSIGCPLYFLAKVFIRILSRLL